MEGQERVGVHHGQHFGDTRVSSMVQFDRELK